MAYRVAPSKTSPQTLFPVVGCLLLMVSQYGRADMSQAEQDARVWMDNYNVEAEKVIYKSTEAAWKYNTNLTQYNQQQSLIGSVNRSNFQKQAAMNTSAFPWHSFADPSIRRQFQKVAELGNSGLPVHNVEEYEKLRSDMQSIYSKATVCGGPQDKCLPLDPDLTEVMASSNDWDTLLWAWEGWREETGPKIKDLFPRSVELSNKAAVIGGFEDTGQAWRSWYEMEDFQGKADELWRQVEPLYRQLQAYVRRKLSAKYKDNPFSETGHIPAHILGNMWAQTWEHVADLVRPYPDNAQPDITQNMKKQGYNVTKMFRLSEEFFVSLGLEPMPDVFWEMSMLEKPKDGRDVVCHASAWDFYDANDFRIKMCTDVTAEDLFTIHHEMGHIQYGLQYRHQPVSFRKGGNPGFHEALGDTIALSVSTPDHLRQIGLLGDIKRDKEADMNYLMKQALEKIAFLPFGYMIDQWRWGVFNGDIAKEDYNKKWIDLRCKYQGIYPPITRTDQDFDPGAKFHIPATVPYVRYFVSFIIQFQFHQALCDAAGHEGPLHRCDIYRSREAGILLKNMMSLGSSEPWPVAMEAITGQRDMNASALMTYFTPLIEWLEEQNQGHRVGWEDECPQGSFKRSGSQPMPSGSTMELLILTVLSILL